MSITHTFQNHLHFSFRFAAQFGVMTEPNGLYYMKARYYDSEVGRFISEDPLGFEGGSLNLYVYAANNPIMFMDPLGLCMELPWWEPSQYTGGLITFGGGLSDEDFAAARARTRMAISAGDVAAQGSNSLTLAMDVGAFAGTWVDIYEADVPLINKVYASGVNIVGLGGVIGVLPSPTAKKWAVAIDAFQVSYITLLLSGHN
jgi:RHS repeat-associated protein